jgi:hypothetical protein
MAKTAFFSDISNFAIWTSLAPSDSGAEGCTLQWKKQSQANEGDDTDPA